MFVRNEGKRGTKIDSSVGVELLDINSIHLDRKDWETIKLGWRIKTSVLNA